MDQGHRIEQITQIHKCPKGEREEENVCPRDRLYSKQDRHNIEQHTDTSKHCCGPGHDYSSQIRVHDIKQEGVSIFKILGKFKEHGIEMKINPKKYTEKKSETALTIEDYFSFKTTK